MFIAKYSVKVMLYVMLNTFVKCNNIYIIKRIDALLIKSVMFETNLYCLKE